MKIFSKLTHRHSLETIEQGICENLEKQGFSHKKQDGHLFVSRGKRDFLVCLWENSNNHIKRVYFVFDFAYDNMDIITIDGWTMAATTINRWNPHITFTVHEDHLRCRFETAICHANDFIPEFDRAYRLIGEAIDDYEHIIPKLKLDYPKIQKEQEAKIGFQR